MASRQKSGSATPGAIAGFDRITGKIRRFIRDTIAELGRCTWPGKQELVESTILVVVVMFVLACFVALVDEVAMLVINLITTGAF